MDNARNRRNKTRNSPSILDHPFWFWTRYQSAIAVGSYILFIFTVITIGTLIVYITSSRRPNKPCKLIFRRSLNPPMISNDADSYPTNVAFADFNEDDYLDLAVADSKSGHVDIFFGYGNGSFTNQSTYSIGLNSYPYWIAVGDFNNDKHVDIVAANYDTNSIAILLGDGYGIFANPIMTSLGPSRPLSLAVGDFNNDNRMDVAVVSSSTASLIILHGLGDGSFQIESINHMGYDSAPVAVAVDDFNNDNQLDFAVVNYGTNELVVILSDENQTFARHHYSTGIRSRPSSIAIADINNDSILDIAIINSGTKTVGIFYGYGNGTFRNLVTQSTGPNSYPWFVAVGDLDDDQISDMIVANTVTDLIIFKGNGNETFSMINPEETGFNSNSYSIAVADFDRDNKSDVIVTNYYMKVLVLTSFTLNAIAAMQSYSTGPLSLPYSLVLADFNGDNELDVVINNLNSKNLVMFIGFGNGSFSPAQTIMTFGNHSPIFIAVGDFNNDNKNDIAMTIDEPNTIGILLGQNNGSFIFGDLYFISNDSVSSSITVVDINNDNNLDIIITDAWMGTFEIFIGYGNGTFHNGIAFYSGRNSRPTSVAVADLNHDHLSDLVVVAPGNLQLSVHLGYINGSFLQSILISTGHDEAYKVLVADLNNDNRFDIVFLSLSSFKIGVCLGYGNGTFGNITTYSTGESSYPMSIVIDDFNRDARLDIAVTSDTNRNVGIFLGHGDGTFTTFRTLASGDDLSPRYLTVGDFNNDHIQDMVAINPMKNTMTVFLIGLLVMFEGQRNYLTGTHPHPSSITIGDLNNDNRLDIIVVNSGHDNVQIFLNDGNQIFLHGETASTGLNSRPQSVIVADFNQDNRSDIATANFKDSSIRVFLGFGNGTLDVASRHSTGSFSFPVSIATGDFNNDSWVDIVVVNQNADNVGIFLGFNYGTFTRYYIQTIEYSMPYYVVAADFNNDSYSDIAVAHWGWDFVHVYLGYGNGSFIRRTELKTGYFPDAICVGDFNHDNHLDMAITAWGNPGISIFFGAGDGTFSKQIFYPMDNYSLPFSIATDDFNNDGILDLVVAARDLDYIVVSMGFGNGTFADLTMYHMPNGSHPSWVVVSDFNNDHIRDIAVANRDQNHIGILFGYGNGTFKDVRIYSTGNNSGPCSITVEDFNQDHLMDIAVANQFSRTIGVFLGYGNGTFSSQTTYSTGSESMLFSINVGDLNNDSVLDIAFTDQDKNDGNIGVFYGSGDGTFLTTAKRYSIGYNSQPSSIAISDLNNDGRLDMVVTNKKNDSIDIMLGDKSEAFGSQTVFSTGRDSQPIAVAVNDFNNDQKLDIAVANSMTNNIGIFLGYNNGTFARQQTYSTGDSSHPLCIAIADMNNDTELDLIVTNYGTDEICILLGYGNGSFILGRRYSTGKGSAPRQVAVGDLNKDDYFDLVIAIAGTNKILIFYGQSNGNFSSSDSYSLGYGANPISIVIGDLNNDNLLDIAVAEYGRNYIDIFFQTCL